VNEDTTKQYDPSSLLLYYSRNGVEDRGGADIHYGQTDLWLVAFITGLVVTSGLMFQCEPVINQKKQEPRP
jgi:hypothetical protein